MIVLGLTGSMATGKSTVAKLCQNLWHIPLWDADFEVRMLLERPAIQSHIEKVFPHVVINNTVSRPLLRQYVFENPHELSVLESILYPHLLFRVKKYIQYHHRLASPIILLDIPLLFEKGWEGLCDYVMVATCKMPLQKHRILQRSGMTKIQMNQILNQQYPQSLKKKWADFEIKTDLSKRYTLQQLQNILRQICPQGAFNA